jgi:hypothetical protein
MFSDFQLLMNMGPLALGAFFVLAFWSLAWKGLAM